MRSVSRVSNVVLGLEKRLLAALAGALVVLILLNIVTRAAGAALFWVDELAIYTMIWMALTGASAMVRMRTGVAVTLVIDILPRAYRRAANRIVDAILLVLALTLLVLCWQWYDPVALLESGLDLDVFAESTFKFIYIEPTSTIGIRKFWVWLAVPFMASAMTIHALANLLEGPREEVASVDVGARPSSGA
ncbi:MAG TPA: TRAP transporter small permease [Gammaproteobacteria bacterium]|nr:TRAP transporter small permease [Gammaproteobacteria bacterium]